MKLHYFQGEIPNFGDDLNPYIFESLFPNLFSRNDDINFYGIGSILDNRIPAEEKAIIFGTGVRGIQADYPTQNWDIRFVRGPISARALQCKYITDGAYCLPLLSENLFNPGKAAKKYKYSFVPYFRHLNNKALLSAFTDNNIHIISPVEPLQQVIDEIAASEFVICGAMHGAIVADICRVPWARFVYGLHGYESRYVSELKWADWMNSVKVDPSNMLEAYLPNKVNNKVLRKLNEVFYNKSLTDFVANQHRKQQLYQLSADFVMEEVINKLSDEVNALAKQYS
ncbi:polysaccharide pyruvyl transferase family protein [Mucilaginibacter lacusdianchii]|uniref:polysaccharide pyruvyl transferase family protein n=1 Tax=Mucilaginibacter lacusdianchii TaxID=2684211 RepID=UPI00131E9D42|nr:polysaccharide pyruvyl transferase family protein [Mucilaginibacter sp. JXJ CY 39]